MWHHLVGHVQEDSIRLTDQRVSGAVWSALRQAFPEVAAALLMPDHFHLLTRGKSARELRERQARAISGLSRSKRLEVGPPRWLPVPEPSPIADTLKLARSVRYLALNPCRAHYVDDPLRWRLSTHLDVMGFVAVPWVDAACLAHALDRKLTGFEEWLQRYLSSDPAVHVQGTPPPRPLHPAAGQGRADLERVILAAAIATRARPADIFRRTATRRLFVQLAWEAGWTHPGLLARQCGITSGAVGLLRSRRDHRALAAGLRCLAEDRVLSSEPRFPRIRLRLGDPRDQRFLEAVRNARPQNGLEPEWARGEE